MEHTLIFVLKMAQFLPWPGGSVGWSTVQYTKAVGLIFGQGIHLLGGSLILGPSSHGRRLSDVSLSETKKPKHILG